MRMPKSKPFEKDKAGQVKERQELHDIPERFEIIGGIRCA